MQQTITGKNHGAPAARHPSFANYYGHIVNIVARRASYCNIAIEYLLVVTSCPVSKNVSEHALCCTTGVVVVARSNAMHGMPERVHGYVHMYLLPTVGIVCS